MAQALMVPPGKRERQILMRLSHKWCIISNSYWKGKECGPIMRWLSLGVCQGRLPWGRHTLAEIDQAKFSFTPSKNCRLSLLWAARSTAFFSNLHLLFTSRCKTDGLGRWVTREIKVLPQSQDVPSHSNMQCFNCFPCEIWTTDFSQHSTDKRTNTQMFYEKRRKNIFLSQKSEPAVTYGASYVVEQYCFPMLLTKDTVSGNKA